MGGACRVATRVGGGALLLLAAVLLSAGPVSGQGGQLASRGKYILGAAAGCGCHTEPGKAEPGKTLNAGGRRYDGPFGTVYSTNITPDRQTGIGSWTDEQIIAAIRLGRRPNGDRLIPVHPYPVSISPAWSGSASTDVAAAAWDMMDERPVGHGSLGFGVHLTGSLAAPCNPIAVF